MEPSCLILLGKTFSKFGESGRMELGNPSTRKPHEIGDLRKAEPIGIMLPNDGCLRRRETLDFTRQKSVRLTPRQAVICGWSRIRSIVATHQARAVEDQPDGQAGGYCAESL